MKKILILTLAFFVPLINWAQCAMCRTQIKNNVSAGETNVAEGLNNGIMFLFFTPYLVVFAIFFFWYRNSKIKKHVSLNERIKG
ncbi:hypothetical protein SAMN05421640_1232 [Ekhidna lutea]|uniref:Uncharacterized protein n=1 Tax=Ekhidna lutea TaxID=447679 RepID=A0A239HAY6_EKHLU|nr:hypothetical protein [Ekhidna lutea]SNS78596.1 hypothetical protein SAMN05421640_1232 [Ekhidna lutea]